MKTISIIGANSAATSSTATGKTSGASPSDHSFGHVLSREVNDRSNVDHSANGHADNKVSGSQADGSASSSAAAGNAKVDNKIKRGGDSSAANAAASNTSESAQILALVANVQQTDSNNGSAPASSNAVSDALTAGKPVVAVGAVPQNTPSNLPAATAGVAGTANTTNTDALPVAVAAGTDQPQPVATPIDVEQTGSATQPITAERSATNVKSAQLARSAVNPGTDNANASSSVSPALDLGVAVEKDIQAGLPAADAANPVKIAPASPAIVSANILQQTMVNALASPGNPGDKLTPPVGSPTWDQALGQKVVWMVAGGQQSASLTLNPPDLGPMQVVLNVSNSHATVTFTAAQPEVRQALETALPKLREMLGDAGIQLGQTTVNSGAQQQNAGAGQSANNSNSSQFNNTPDTAETSIAAMPAVTSAGLGLVDTFA
ncbi:MAG: flagellar hook-length control protein FliK [Burkholderiales bacterium]